MLSAARGPTWADLAYDISKSQRISDISRFQVGFLDFKLDFWISSRFLDFLLYFWISSCISGFLVVFLDFELDFWISRFPVDFQFDFNCLSRPLITCLTQMYN